MRSGPIAAFAASQHRGRTLQTGYGSLYRVGCGDDSSNRPGRDDGGDAVGSRDRLACRFSVGRFHWPDTDRNDPDRIVTFGIRPTYPAESLVTSSEVRRSTSLAPTAFEFGGFAKSQTVPRPKSTWQRKRTIGTVAYLCGALTPF